MCMPSAQASAPNATPPSFVHNPYLDGGAFGNSVAANRVGTSALTIGLDPTAGAGASAGPAAMAPAMQKQVSPLNPTANLTVR